MGFTTEPVHAKPPLDTELNIVLQSVRARPAHIQRAQNCIQELRHTLNRIHIPWSVEAFGSIANGLGTSTSDLDATCYDVENSGTASPRRNLEVLGKLADALAEHGRFVVLDSILSARVPILKLRFDGRFDGWLDVDLSFNNTEPFANTQLLRAYSDLNPLVRDVLILIKQWAKGSGCVGAKEGHLSSYSLTLMALYCMQVDLVVGLPCFPTQDFTGVGGTPSCAQISWASTLSISMILYRIFAFYENEFRWGDEVIAVGVGRRTSRFDSCNAGVKDVKAFRLHIVDPFLTARNLNCVLGIQQEYLLYDKICEAAMAFRQGMLPAGLCAVTGGNFPAPLWNQQLVNLQAIVDTQIQQGSLSGGVSAAPGPQRQQNVSDLPPPMTVPVPLLQPLPFTNIENGIKPGSVPIGFGESVGLPRSLDPGSVQPASSHGIERRQMSANYAADQWGLSQPLHLQSADDILNGQNRHVLKGFQDKGSCPGVGLREKGKGASQLPMGSKQSTPLPQPQGPVQPKSKARHLGEGKGEIAKNPEPPPEHLVPMPFQRK